VTLGLGKPFLLAQRPGTGTAERNCGDGVREDRLKA
jgi:hypothetical protein